MAMTLSFALKGLVVLAISWCPTGKEISVVVLRVMDGSGGWGFDP
jgi:hypothetical protein